MQSLFGIWVFCYREWSVMKVSAEKHKTEKLNLRIEPALKNDLLALARAKGISYSEVIRQMINKQVKSNKTSERFVEHEMQKKND